MDFTTLLTSVDGVIALIPFNFEGRGIGCPKVHRKGEIKSFAHRHTTSRRLASLRLGVLLIEEKDGILSGDPSFPGDVVDIFRNERRGFLRGIRRKNKRAERVFTTGDHIGTRQVHRPYCTGKRKPLQGLQIR